METAIERLAALLSAIEEGGVEVTRTGGLWKVRVWTADTFSDESEGEGETLEAALDALED